MKKIYIKTFQSIKNFDQNLSKTSKLIKSLMTNIIGIEAFFELTVKKREATTHEKKMMRLFTVSKKDRNQIFEMGFITLFSHFEFFMYDFLRDLFFKFPKSFSSEISFNEIRGLTNVKKINEYVADATAISKSYDIDKWLEFLKNTYGIEIFKDKEDTNRLLMLNELRNVFLHSDGKTNTKFSNKMKLFLKTPVPINKKVNLDRERYFLVLHGFLKKLLGNLKKL